MSYNFTYNPPYQVPQPGSVTYSGGGGGYLLSGARSIQDARRMMQTGRVPSAEYPDGYLGTIGAGTRRQDRLLNNIGNRATQRSYQRGVHKGERIDPVDYYWPDDFHPLIGLEYEAAGRRWTAQGTQVGAPLVNNGRAQTAAYRNPDPTQDPPFNAAQNDDRRDQLSRMRPAWR
jgi:hypothetical protein